MQIRSRLAQLVVALLAVLGGALAAPAASQAGVATVEHYPLCHGFCEEPGERWRVFYADPSHDDAGASREVNTVTVADAPVAATVQPVVSIRDTTAVVTAGEGCERISDHEAWCTYAGEYGGQYDRWGGADLRLGGLGDTATIGDVALTEGLHWLRGGTGDDTLTGGAEGDSLYGGAGDDLLEGGAGDDELTGGDGIDTITYGSRDTGERVAVRLDGKANDGADPDGNGTSSSAEEADHDSGVERVIGGAGHDRLFGSAGANRLTGGPGDDTLDGGRGGDVLDGGPGSDRTTYASRTDGTPVAIRLDGGYNDGADPNGDGVSGASEEADRDISIENATGASGNDRLFGGAGANSLLGWSGDDVIDGRAGADTINGGPGSDTMSYATRTGAMAVRLDGARNDGFDRDGNGTSSAGEENDRDYSIENVTGGSGLDLIRAQLASANVLTGNGGNDRLFARDGTATADTLSCGDGTDQVQTDPGDATSACETAVP